MGERLSFWAEEGLLRVRCRSVDDFESEGCGSDR